VGGGGTSCRRGAAQRSAAVTHPPVCDPSDAADGAKGALADGLDDLEILHFCARRPRATRASCSLADTVTRHRDAREQSGTGQRTSKRTACARTSDLTRKDVFGGQTTRAAQPRPAATHSASQRPARATYPRGPPRQAVLTARPRDSTSAQRSGQLGSPVGRMAREMDSGGLPERLAAVLTKLERRDEFGFFAQPVDLSEVRCSSRSRAARAHGAGGTRCAPHASMRLASRLVAQQARRRSPRGRDLPNCKLLSRTTCPRGRLTAGDSCNPPPPGRRCRTTCRVWRRPWILQPCASGWRRGGTPPSTHCARVRGAMHASAARCVHCVGRACVTPPHPPRRL
jgi:hypothetical protein